ncbi:MAG: MotA/TolQ/ExbB proton channel family protein [Planctomycetes bacterium]|nr:MotA/TolQ/ExbB proton channel family protein [Planctomycetota bacterium]
MWSVIERGGYVMYPLLGTSVVALAITLERAVFWLLAGLRTKHEKIEEVLDIATDMPGKAEDLARASGKSPAMRVLAAGLEHRTSGYREVLEMAAEEEVATSRRGMMVLDTIITMAPLLGILGTVIGIIQSFELLGDATIGDPRGVSSGIAQALITTAAGLTIAIATLLPYNYFNSRIDQLTQYLEKAATRLEIALTRWRRRQGMDNPNEEDVQE